jgi:hypothetical protein
MERGTTGKGFALYTYSRRGICPPALAVWTVLVQAATTEAATKFVSKCQSQSLQLKYQSQTV